MNDVVSRTLLPTIDDEATGLVPQASNQKLEELFEEFEPTKYDDQGFGERKANWLSQSDTEDDRETLLSLYRRLYYISRMEYQEIYRYAFRDIVTRWHMDLLKKTDLSWDLSASADHSSTWYTSVTDSLEIARFHHLNGIRGQDIRPEWHSLSVLGSKKHINRYIQSNEIKRIVVLEDFVGTGDQAGKALDFALACVPESVPLLFIPMIVCPSGDANLSERALRTINLHYEPLLVLPEACFVKRDPTPGEPPGDAQVRDIVQRYSNHTGTASDFGYGGTGALVVLHTNTPNNSLAIIHAQTDRWTALFPRSSRI